ncbi:DUF4089 domain-containing protein [Roseococcus sp. YIM B11640]|uniref:DUF4089 domain-containing protein n=1 Tax=Roseococcus sp. YIM B11640 TaxID=3133973 RepID=UPI003C7D9350
MPEFDPARYAEQTAAALEMELRPEHLPGIHMNLALAHRMAKLVESVPLTPHDETAPVYVAGPAK